MVTDPSRLTASQAALRLRDGSLSAETLARACLDRVAARDATVRAWTHLDPALVLAQASALDRRGWSGPLHGLPVGVKDIIFTRDMPTQYNSPLYQGFHPELDASCVTLLRNAGAVIFGKTDTVEFAATGRKALSRNPHDTARTPGGSSSGSAVAVADFHVPLALATQTGGSTIRPASFCGIHAIKPTWNLVSLEGVRRFAVSLDTLGWFGRSAADLSLVYDIFDPGSAAVDAIDIRHARIAICRSPGWPLAGPATIAAMVEAEATLREAGAAIADLELPAAFDDLVTLQGQLMRAEGRGAFLAEYRTQHDLLDQSFRDQVENADGISGRELARIHDLAARGRAEFDRLAGDFDAVLTPSTVDVAPRGLSNTGDFVFNAMWSLLHVPCINLPYFRDAGGLPVGLTLTAPRYSDRRLLAVAEALDRLFAPTCNPPELGCD